MQSEGIKKSNELLRKIIEVPLYTAGISLYRFGVRVAGLWNEKADKLNRGQRQVYKTLTEKLAEGDKIIWIHTASLGEFEQGRPMIERIKKDLPEYKILLTFFSPSGYEVRKDFEGADCVTYLPFDTPLRVRKFLNRVNPAMAIFVKYEIWRNYLYALKSRHIPAYLISAAFRSEQYFFKYPDSWYADWLRQFERIFVQDSDSRKLLEKVGITNAVVAGDTRFDRVMAIREARREVPEIEEFKKLDPDAPLLMIGSSWEADEDVYAEWVNKHRDVRVIIAPHEFDTRRLESLKKRFTGGAVLLSEVRKNSSLLGSRRPHVLILDCFGLLSSAYFYCDIAYVGGGFGAGLHNINEAAVYGVPVIYGPNNKKFIEARELAESGGGLEIESKEDFNRTADMLLDAAERQRRGNASEKYIKTKLGATDKIFNTLF